MKPRNLLATTKKALLLTVLPGLLAACKSREEKIAEIDTKVEKIEIQIDSARVQRDRAVATNVANLPMYSILKQWLDEDYEKIDSISLNNFRILDSIQHSQAQKASMRFPLSTFLSKKDLTNIKSQLKETYNNSINQKNIKNIMADRGTLLDLYNVSYELNYLIYDMPFYITNDYGGITFKNKNVNAIAQKFAKELMRIYSQPASDIIRKYPKKAEFIKAQNEINEYNRRCAIVDSIYTDAELKIAPRFNATIDSLKQEKRKLRIKQEMLISRQNQSQK